MKRILVLVIGLTIAVFTSCVKPKTSSQPVLSSGRVEINCMLMMGDKPFYFDSIYTSPGGEAYSINNLKFFISDIAFSRSNTAEQTAQSDSALQGVFLVDFLEANRNAGNGVLQHTTYFNIQTGDYSDLRFNIGIPRALNHGDPTQAPYPLNVGNTDMFWEWNSGYIFFLAEGKSLVAEDSILHFAIGGDKQIMPISFGDILRRNRSAYLPPCTTDASSDLNE
jgi:hypothetical protein